MSENEKMDLVLEVKDYLHAVERLFEIQPEGDCLAERKPTKDESAYRAFMYLNDQGKRLRAALTQQAAPSVQPNDDRPDQNDAAVWRENVADLLDHYPGSIRSRQGGGAENLIESLCITFIKLSAGKPAPSGPEQNLRVRIRWMHDDHTFTLLQGRSVDDIIEAAERAATEACGSLCPAIVLDGDKELRRVGPHIMDNRWNHKKDEWKRDLAAWRAAIVADPDISRLLAAAPDETGAKS